MLPLTLNNKLKYPIIIFHDSLLPRYRGFAPTPTAIIAGDDAVGVTMLFASDEVDSGEIIWQKKIPISSNDYIQTVIDKQAKAYVEGFFVLIENIENENLISTPQDDGLVTYSIWRTNEDCSIDWNKSSTEIYNLIRAVGTPYQGAYTQYKNKKITVIRSEIVHDIPFVIRDCGKIWRIEENCPYVICGRGILKITEATDAVGNLVKFDRVRIRLV